MGEGMKTTALCSNRCVACHMKGHARRNQKLGERAAVVAYLNCVFDKF
jgi:hypothetical protein